MENTLFCVNIFAVAQAVVTNFYCAMLIQAHVNYLRSLHDLLGKNLNPASSSSSTTASWENLTSCVTESGKALNDVIKKMRREVSA